MVRWLGEFPDMHNQQLLNLYSDPSNLTPGLESFVIVVA